MDFMSFYDNKSYKLKCERITFHVSTFILQLVGPFASTSCQVSHSIDNSHTPA